MRTGELLRIVCLAMLVPALRPLSAAAVVQADSRPPSVQPSRETSEEEPADDSSALSIEETLGRYQQLLERRPLHAQAFAGLVKHFAELGKMADLVKEYEAKVESLPDNVAIKVVLARLYMRAGQPEKAAELLDRIGPAAEKLGRDESKWLVFKAEVFQKTHRLDQAQSVLDEALSKAKTVSERLRLAEALADLHLAAGDKDQAAAALTRLAREYADNYLHRKRIAEALAQRDLHEQAVAELRAMLPLTEGKSDQRCETLRQLGRSLERLSRTQEAIDAYSEAVNLLAAGHWLQQELHERIVTLYRASGRLEDLVKYCRAQLERAPEQTGMRVLLADVLTASGDNAGARQTLEEAVQLFPKDRMLSERRVQFLERINEAAAAASEYERILAQQPDDVELYIAYGQFLANHQQLEAARNQWKHVLNSALTDATLAQRLGSLFEPYELLDDAAECYERAVQLSPSRPESYAALARLWFARGEKEKALATLKRMSAAAADDASNQAAVCQVAAGLGLTDEALAAITRACELAPKQADYQTSRADLLIQSGRLDEALRVRRAALALLTQPGQLAQAVNILVSLHATAGKLDALKSAEQQRLEDSPHDTLSLILLARAADFDRDFAAARKWLDRLLEIEPAHEEARHQLARLLEATGDVDSAVEAYRKLIDLHPARARQWYQSIADLRLRYDDKGGAVETFARIVQTSPGNATVLKDVAEQLARMGELEKAIDYYEQSLRLQSDRHEIRLQYANTLSEAGRLDDALLAYKAVALQRSDRDSAMEAMTKLHEVAGRIGALDELLDELQAQVEANPENTLVAHALAELLIREYEYTRAMELIDLVLRNQPRDAELQLVRGELLRRLAKFDDALETYRRVLRFPDMDRDFVLGEMGKACFEAGRIEQARAFWRQISHKLYAGSLLRNNGLLKDAIEILQEGIRLKPDDYGLHRSLIRTLAAAGKQDEALDAARRLLDLEPENVLNIRDLAKAYLERGRARLSLAAFGESAALLVRGARRWDGLSPELREKLEYARSLPALYAERTKAISSGGHQDSEELAKLNQRILEVEKFRDAVAGSVTDIERALRLALNCGSSDERRTIYLLSDANFNRGRWQTAWTAAESSGTKLHLIVLDKPTPPEVAAADLQLPASVRVDQGFAGEVRIASTVETSAELRVYKDGYLQQATQVQLHAGQNVFKTASLHCREKGFHAIEVSVKADQDTQLANNRVRALLVVPGETRVLYVDRDIDQIPYLKGALELEGMQVEARSAAGVPQSLSELLSFDAFILCNVPADRLSMRQMQMIRTYVQDFGGGFIMLGGDESFGLGGYYNTPIEEILPVKMPIQKDLLRPSLAIMLLIDKSGSMEGVKIQIAKRAAIATSEAINPRDLIGVVGFDSEARVLLELTPAADRQTISGHIAALEAGGGTFLYPALQEAHERLVNSNARRKHVIVLSDGQTQGFGYEELVGSMAADGISLSAVGIGDGADMRLMESIANAGGGRAYFTNDFNTIPQIFTREALRASRSMLVERLVQPSAIARDPVLEEIDTDELPALTGYVATTPKPAASTLIVSDSGDPLLAKWRYGLGRTAAFTSEPKPRWAEDWVEWDDFAKFWSQLIRGITGQDLARKLHIETAHRLDGAEAVLTADVRDAADNFAGGLELELTAVVPGGLTRSLPVASVGPGLYEARFPEFRYSADQQFVWRVRTQDQQPAMARRSAAPADAAARAAAGTNRNGIDPQHDADPVPENSQPREEPEQTQPYGFVYAFSPEFATLGPSAETVDQIRSRGAGEVLSVASARIASSAAPAKRWIPLWPYLLILALLLAPVDILIRRIA